MGSQHAHAARSGWDTVGPSVYHGPHADDVDVVGDVRRIYADLQLFPLADTDIALEREVHRKKTWAGNCIAPGVSELAWCRDRKRLKVKEADSCVHRQTSGRRPAGAE